jgi:hypothetical protein
VTLATSLEVIAKDFHLLVLRVAGFRATMAFGVVLDGQGSTLPLLLDSLPRYLLRVLRALVRDLPLQRTTWMRLDSINHLLRQLVAVADRQSKSNDLVGLVVSSP